MVAEGEGALGPTAGPQPPDLLRLHEAIASLFATQGDWRRAYQHLRSALASGDLSVAELQEFLLHFAYYAGWPRASLVHHTLTAVVAELGPASEPAGEAGSDAGG